MKKLDLAYKMLKATTAYELKQITVDKLKYELIVITNGSRGTFGHIKEVAPLETIGCSCYVAYNAELNTCELHIF